MIGTGDAGRWSLVSGRNTDIIESLQSSVVYVSELGTWMRESSILLGVEASWG